MIYLTNHEPDLVKTCLNVKDPYEAKYQLLINKERENKGKQKSFKWFYAFTEHPNNTDDIYENIEESKKRNIIFFCF